MKSKSISAFFAENLNAPLANVQWSWGAENEKGVYLRIWAIEVDGNEGLVCKYSVGDSRLGQKERLRHIKEIEQGKLGYVVVLTEGSQPEGGTWRIEKYEECIYPIQGFSKKENGDIYAIIDFETPIYPDLIGSNVDFEAIKAAAGQNKKSLDIYVKAVEEYSWQPTKLDEGNGIIFFVSKDGTKKAQLNIAAAKWVR